MGDFLTLQGLPHPRTSRFVDLSNLVFFSLIFSSFHLACQPVSVCSHVANSSIYSKSFIQEFSVGILIYLSVRLLIYSLTSNTTFFNLRLSSYPHQTTAYYSTISISQQLPSTINLYTGYYDSLHTPIHPSHQNSIKTKSINIRTGTFCMFQPRHF